MSDDVAAALLQLAAKLDKLADAVAGKRDAPPRHEFTEEELREEEVRAARSRAKRLALKSGKRPGRG